MKLYLSQNCDKMKNMKWQQHKYQLLQNKAVQRSFEETELEYQIARAIIKARLKTGLSQQELAQKLHTQQSVISRVENAKTTPSLSFLRRLATVFNMRLTVQFET